MRWRFHISIGGQPIVSFKKKEKKKVQGLIRILPLLQTFFLLLIFDQHKMSIQLQRPFYFIIIIRLHTVRTQLQTFLLFS